MKINFTQQDHENIAKLFDYNDLTKKDRQKAINNFKKLLESNDAPRYLYVIRCLPYNYYKIGITNDLDKRLKNHQTGCPFDLKMIFAVEADMEDFLGREITYIEGFFRRNYKNSIVRGEWFELTEQEISDMCIFLENNREFDILHENPEELSAYFKTVEETELENGL